MTELRRAALILVLAGMAGCATFSDDPQVRTPGTMIDDQVIETMVKRAIWNADPAFDSAHLVAVSYNGVLLLAGQVESEDLRRRAEEIAQGHDKVRKVHNELEIGGPTSMVARANDSWLTTKVKTRMLADAEVAARKIKVVTENGTVYLMGLLPREEADLAVEVARSVYGVQKIVKVFEYI
jgi:osmotically-inducible protein OsmY